MPIPMKPFSPAPGLLLLACSFFLTISTVYAQAPAPPRTLSEELRALYEADQEDRSGGVRGQELRDRDQQRRDRVTELLKADLLESAADYYHAAMIYQHSIHLEDYLTAHVLATVAGFKGHEQGKWLSAASLDRFLSFSKQRQFFGTQYQQDDDGLWQPGAFNDVLIEGLRNAYNLPTLEEMAERAASFNKPRD